VFPAIVALGLFLTMKLRCIQLSKLKMSLQALIRSGEGQEGNMSHYQAVSTVVAGNLGTGNISGMAVALTAGGPGALVWMWVMAFLGTIIQYSSCLLAVKYRHRDASGEYVGGPMYYLKEGVKSKTLAVCFSVFTLLAAITVGNFAQVNSISLPLASLGIPSWLVGMGLMGLATLVIVGGMGRIAKVASSIVPVMALLYLAAGSAILCAYSDRVLEGLSLMIKSAFQYSSFSAGALGFGVFKALTTGFERGVFATDAGTGIVPILQSGARTKHPVVDGIATLIAPFLVMLICTMTGLILIVTGAFERADLQSTNMVIYAFQSLFGEVVGMGVVLGSLFLFGYTTIIAWGACGEKAMQFLWDQSRVKYFRAVYLLLIPVGAIAKVDVVWVLADIAIAFMLMTNLLGIGALSSEVIKETRLFFTRKQESL